MPYNTTAIPPRREPTGTAQLPLSRVRRIVQVDQDIAVCSNAASFVITIATEMFIQYLAEQGHNIVRSERKPRRNIQYRDLSQAVRSIDNLEFLSDIVPKTVPFKEVKDKKAPTSLNNSSLTHPSDTADPSNSSVLAAGQTTLNGFGGTGSALNGGRRESIDMDDDSTIADPNEQLKMESRGASARVSADSEGVNGVNEGEKEGSEDVEMS